MAVKIYNVINRGIRIRENGVFTAPELIADAGVFFEEAGGYYAGGNILVDDKEYAIIISPKAQGDTSDLYAYTATTPYAGANSTYNGKYNMNKLIDNNLSNYPAATFCNNLDVNGFNDWHLPSPDELEICYRYLKPTDTVNNTANESPHSLDGENPNSNPVGSVYTSSNPLKTNVTIFQEGNTQAFINSKDVAYYTSMEYDNQRVWIQAFNQGNQYYFTKSNEYGVRAIRWMEV